MSAARRPLAIAVVLVAVTAMQLGALTAPGVGQRTYPTWAYVGYKYPAFRGVLGSKIGFCIAERPVKVYRERPGPDKLLGATRTGVRGKWEVRLGKLSPGTFYVRAPLYGSASLGIDCRAARSRLVVLD